MKKNVALFFGGRSLESDISVITAMQALKNVDKSTLNVEPVYMSDGDFYVDKFAGLKDFAPFNPLNHKKVILQKGGLYELKRGGLKRYFKPDVALICCHGGEGEGGALQALLDFNGIPYTSPSMTASAVGMDKTISKRMFEDMCFNVLPYAVLTKGEFEKNPELVLDKIKLEYPLIVKPARLGSSIGVGVAENREELSFALSAGFNFDEKVLIEHKLTKFLEVNCAAFLDKGQIIVSETEMPITYNSFLTFDDKYSSGGKMSGERHIMPANIGELNDIIKENTKSLYEKLGLNGVVRVDYLVDEERKKVYINEINTVPGSLAYYLFEPLGISFDALINRLVENAACDSRKVYSVLKPDILTKFAGGAKISKTKL